MDNNINLIIEELYNIMETDAIEKARESRKDFNNYKLNGKNIPRVTKIIDSCVDNAGLLIWAVNLGSKQYYAQQTEVTTIGTKVHEAIEEYINGNEPKLNYNSILKKDIAICQAYDNFVMWLNCLIEMGHTFTTIGTEIKIVTPFYAGTIDCICKIDNYYYIIDFKTSKELRYDYFIQVCAYKWAVDNGYLDPKYNIGHINGIGLIRVDKTYKKFEDLFMNENNLEQLRMINYYQNTFFNMLHLYYDRINCDYSFHKYKKTYNHNIESGLITEENNK